MKPYFHLKTSLFLFFPYFLIAQTISPRLIGSRYAALGNASVALRDAQSLFSNSAGLMGVENKTLILNSAWFYGVNDLKPIAVGFVMPNPSGVLGFSFKHFGFESLKDNTLGVAYARKFSSKLDAGIQLNYSNITIKDNGSRNVIGFDIGFNTLIIKDLYMAFHVQNPIPIQSPDSDKTPSVFRLGLAYSVNTAVLMVTEIKKDLSYPASVRIGMAYKPTDKTEFRGGFETQPVKIAFGFGYVLTENLNADLAVSSHSVLGLTPSLSIHYVFKK